MNTLWCVAEGSSHALLWLYKESVFRGLQCGDAWHGSVKLAVKPTETGMGHRQQHRWRVSLCFFTLSALSVWLCVCVGWRDVSVCLYLCIFGNLMVWNNMYTCTHGTAFMEDYQWACTSKKPPSLHPFTCSFFIHAHNFSVATSHAHTHQTLCTAYGAGFIPLFPLLKPEVIINHWWIHL